MAGADMDGTRVDLAVVGAGVMGLGVAWRCARAGMRVVCVDPTDPGRGATWASAGMLAPLAEAEFHEEELLALGLWSQELWPGFAAELEAASGRTIGLDACGALVVALDRDDAEGQLRVLEYLRARGIDVRRISGAAARELEPLLSPRVHSATWSPSELQVDNRALADALVAAAVGAGVELIQATVQRVDVAAGCVAGVELPDGRRLGASRALIAAGAWSRAIDGLGPWRPPVRPVKGQMLSLRTDDRYPLYHVIRSPHAYLAPKRDRWVVGATSEERGFDGRVTAGGVWSLLDGAYEVVPAVSELELVETWSGFRPASRDSGPILGGCDVRGLFFCTGHYRHGIQQAPASIEAVSRWILDGEIAEPIGAFGIGRFAAAAGGS